MNKVIPLSVPMLKGNELKYVKECIDTEWVSSAGKYVNLFEENIAKKTGAKFAIGCVNGTSALQLSLMLAGVRSSDEVLVPSLTFIASVNSIAYNGASPVFMDSDSYFNIDIEKTIEFIQKETNYKKGFTYNRKTNKRISAIMPVHVWGNAVWLDELVEICSERNISIVEDASESLGTYYAKGNYKHKHTGTIGKLGCISFNGNKIITTGGGGMILTNDSVLAEKAHYLTTQAKDDGIRYIHNEIGYNFRLTNIQAALGVAQLEQLPSFLKKKRQIYLKYCDAIKNLKGLSIADVPSYSSNNHWINILKIDSLFYKYNQEELMDKLNQKKIQTRPPWVLNHMQKPYKNYQSYKIENSKDLVKESLCLPSSSNLEAKEIKEIVKNLDA